MNGVCRCAADFVLERRGSIAIKFALVVPIIALVGAGAIDLLAVKSSQSRLQSTADAAALAGAQSLTLAADKIVAEEAAASHEQAAMSQWTSAPTYTGAYSVSDAKNSRSLTVTLNGHRPSFFGSLLPPGGWKFSASATASPVGQTPLCAIGTGGNKLDSITSSGSSRITAPLCMVHSNGNILIRNQARINAAAVQAVKGATQSGISPAAGQGAVPIEDPFASMIFPPGRPCDFDDDDDGKEEDDDPLVLEDRATHYLDPGTHCRPIIVKNTTHLILRKGEHVFRQNLSLQGTARLSGNDVFLFFDRESDPNFTGPHIRVDLVGRKSGTYAGMVMATIAGERPDIAIPGSRVERLLGVVYVRKGVLSVTGSGEAASASDWTVVVANQIQLSGTATLKINADYDNSDVPVPNGVGPNGGGYRGTRLSD